MVALEQYSTQELEQIYTAMGGVLPKREKTIQAPASMQGMSAYDMAMSGMPQNPTIDGTAVGRGFQQGYTASRMDEAQAGLAAPMASAMTGRPVGESYDAALDKARQPFNESAEQSPKSYGGGYLFGAAVSPLTKLAVTKAPFKGGALLGGLYASGETEADFGSGEYIKDTLVGTGLGAAAGKGLEMGMKFTPAATVRLIRSLGDVGKKLNPRAKEAPEIFISVDAQKSGITPESIMQNVTKLGDEAKASFTGAVEKGYPADIALKKAKADEFGIPLSKGDLLQDVNQQRLEEAALVGNLTDESQMVAQGFRQDQQQAIGEAGKGVAERFAPTVKDSADVFDEAVTKLRSTFKEDKRVANAGYETLKGKSRATIPKDAYDGFVNNLKRTITDDFPDRKQMPATNDILEQFEKIQGRSDVSGVNHLVLHSLRKRATASMGIDSSNATQKQALRVVNDSIDEFESNLIANNLIKGDESAITAAQNARAGWKAFKQKYYGRDGKKLVGRILENDYTPEKVAQLVIGSGKVGSKKEAGQAVGQLKDILGEGSEEFGQLKQAAFLQMFGRKFDDFLDPNLQSNISGKVFANNVDNLLTNNKTLANALYSKSEQSMLKDFANTFAQATTRQRGAVNYSSSGYYIMGMLNRLAGTAGRIPGLGVPARGAEAMGRVAQESAKKQALGRKVDEGFGDELPNYIQELTRPQSQFTTGLEGRVGGILAGSSAGGDTPSPKVQTSPNTLEDYSTEELLEIYEQYKQSPPKPQSNNNATPNDVIGFVMDDLEGGDQTVTDTGGLTRFGISQNANPDVDVANLSRDQAQQIYKERYWDAIGADDLEPRTATVAFDTAVNHGVGKAKQLLQQAQGDPNALLALRAQEYQRLAQSNPQKYGRYFDGWMNRLKKLERKVS